MCIHVEARGQRCSFSGAIQFDVQSRALAGTWSSQQGSAGPRGLPVATHQHSRIKSTCYHTHAFLWGLVIEHRCSYLNGNPFTKRAVYPLPSFPLTILNDRKRISSQSHGITFITDSPLLNVFETPWCEKVGG